MRQLLAELLALVILSSTLFCWVLGDTHYYEFVLREKKYTRLCNTKSMLVVNDSFPGPVIRVHKGDTVFVNVHNHGDYGVTLHWHGVKQPRNPWSDGPEYITQCPIQPGSNFTYKVLFSTEEGTLWWHAHSDWTQNSVHGAIVIMPAKGTDHPFPKPDEEEIIVLGSWYSYDVNKRVNYDLAIGADLPREEAFLFNGQPGGIFNCSRDTQYRLVVDYGKTYLIRLINAATSSELLFAIADHNVTVVGMDGAYLKPLSTSFLVISPGQTMNLLLTANQPPRQYYMAIRQYVTNGDPDVYPANTAILEYRGNYSRRPDPVFPSQLPSYINISSAEFFLAGLRSLNSKEHPAFVPQEITHHMYIVVSVKQVLCNPSECEIGMAMASAMNNITFLNPHVDVLQAYYRYALRSSLSFSLFLSYLHADTYFGNIMQA
ncbi:unnamed protein product [Thlaspi arvense]|uniref:laccase n=1 Tax=Thlaspi arvense TaxID=13288 RepID=A0AAU9S8P7_THLAR|nr:unnamed protein product [Thlaspi arvense]